MSILERAVPAPEAFYVTGGTLPADAPSYVPRRADHDLLSGLTRGEFCYVLNTRQMGKSSLMVRTAQALRQKGDTVAVLDLTAVGLNLTPEQWYDGLLASLAEQLGLEDALEDFWADNAKLGPLQRFMTAIRQVALPAVSQRLILFVDEIDAVRSLPFPADEFFAAIRECYNRRTQDPEYERLTFCLLGVATPADLIRDTRLSPFNVGRRIALTDFTAAEAAPLANGLPGGQGTLDRVLFWTGGHPYMTQRLCRVAAEEGVTSVAGVDALCERLFPTKQARETDDNLAFVRNRLLRSEADLASLLDLYTQVRAGRRVKDDETNPLCGVLRLSGVANAPEGFLRVRNRVYDRVFDKDWVLAHMPDAELRRQRAAYRRGLARAAAVASVVLLLMGLLTALALAERRAAQAGWRQARAEALRADRSASVAEYERGQAVALASSLKRTLAGATRATTRAHQETLAAWASDRRAQQQTRLAQASEREAVTQKGLAKAAAGRAIQQAEIAHRKTQEALWHQREAVAQKRNAQDTERLADLQLAGQTYDSDTGAPAVVQSLLASSRTWPAADGRERFEWRYQWSQVHDGPQMHGINGVRGAAVTPGGDLVALDDTYRLHRAPVAGGPGSIAALPDPSTVATAALSLDGTRVAVGRQDWEVEVWDIATMHPVASWKAGSASLSQLTFVGTAPGVVQGVWADGSAARWDPATGKEVAHWTAEQGGIPGGYGPEQASQDGRYRAVFTHGKAVLLKETEKARESDYRPSFLNTGSTTSSFGFSPDGRTLAIGDDAGQVSLWDTATAALQRHWLASTGRLLSLQFSPDGGRLATGGEDGLVRVWALPPDVPPGASVEMPAEGAPAKVTSYKGHVDPVVLLSYSSDGHWLTTADRGGTVRAWAQDVSDRRPAPAFSNGQIEALVFPPGGRWLVGVGHDGPAVAWDARTGRPWPLPAWLRAKEGPRSEEDVHALAFSPDGRTAAVSGLDCVWKSPSEKAKGRKGASRIHVYLQFWDRATGKAGPRWEQPLDPNAYLWPDELTALAFSPDGRTLAGGFGYHVTFDPGEAGHLRVWDVATGRTLRVLTGFGNATCALAFSPDGRTLAIGCQDRTVTCFDARTWAETRRMEEGARVLCLAYSPDGRWLATGDYSGAVTVSDTQHWKARSKVGFPGPVIGLCFSPDGRTLASCGISRSVELWDVASLRVMRSVPVDTDCLALAFSPDGTALVVAAGNGALFLRAAPPARVAAWEREESGGQAAQTPSASAAPLTWTTIAQERARARALLADVTARRVPGYAAPVTPGAAENLIRVPAGQSPLGFWMYSGIGQAATQALAPDGTLSVHVRRVDEQDWHVELTHSGLPLQSNTPYILQFRARAASPQTIRVATQPDVPPQDHNGLEAALPLSPEWRAFRLPFRVEPGMPAGGHGELVFDIGQNVNALQFANLVLVPGQAPSPAQRAAAAAAQRRAHDARLRLLSEVTAHRVPGYDAPVADSLIRGGQPPWQSYVAVPLKATVTAAPGGTVTFRVGSVSASPWDVQAYLKPLPLVPGRRYVLQFRARTDRSRPAIIQTQTDLPPWENVGLAATTLDLTPHWQPFRLPFTMGQVPSGHAQLTLCIGQSVGTVQIADAVLVPERVTATGTAADTEKPQP